MKLGFLGIGQPVCILTRIHFCSAKEGQGERVWFIIDESESERVETMLLPEDY